MRKEEMAKEMDPEKLKVSEPLTQDDYYVCGDVSVGLTYRRCRVRFLASTLFHLVPIAVI